MARFVTGMVWLLVCAAGAPAFAIVGGVDSAIDGPDPYPAVRMLVRPGGRMFCTGTFIGPHTMLTAAHCLVAAFKKSVALQTRSGPGTDLDLLVEGVSPELYRIHPDYPRTHALERPDLDVAILEFPKRQAGRDVKPFPYVAISRSAPAVRERVHLVGFGRSDIEGHGPVGEKRRGYNFIADRGNGVLVIKWDEGAASRAFTWFGDSGGALFNVDGALVGVISNAEFVPASRAAGSRVYSFRFVDLSDAAMRAYLHDTIKELRAYVPSILL